MIWFPILNLLGKRSLIFELAINNIKIRFKGTYLGFLWNALEPLLTFILLYVVFTSIRLRVGEHFAIYLITGLLVYHIFARGTLAGLSSLRINSGILKSLAIKRETFPVSSTLATAILSVVEILVLLMLMPFFQFIPSFTMLLIPIPIILILVLVLGLSYILSIIHVYVRDIQTIWGVGVHALFFVSPIFWYIEEVKGIVLGIHSINPVGQIIELTHKIVVFKEIPPLGDWLYATIFVFGILFFGYAVFRKYENRITEEL